MYPGSPWFNSSRHFYLRALSSSGNLQRSLVLPPSLQFRLDDMVSAKTFELFIGAWTLLNITRTQNGNEITDDTYREDPQGVISYTPSGYMSAVLTASEPDVRPLDLTLPSLPSQPDSEWALVGKHSLGYSGPFYFNDSVEVSDTKGQVVHGPLISATLPKFVGSLQRREFEFYEDGMVLKLVGNLGNGVVDDLFWRRLPVNVTLSDCREDDVMGMRGDSRGVAWGST